MSDTWRLFADVIVVAITGFLKEETGGQTRAEQNKWTEEITGYRQPGCSLERANELNSFFNMSSFSPLLPPASTHPHYLQ